MTLATLTGWRRRLLLAACWLAGGTGSTLACDLQVPAAEPLGFYRPSSPSSMPRPLGVRVRSGTAVCSGTLQVQGSASFDTAGYNLTLGAFKTGGSGPGGSGPGPCNATAA